LFLILLNIESAFRMAAQQGRHGLQLLHAADEPTAE
jgi:hypothetical protein